MDESSEGVRVFGIGGEETAVGGFGGGRSLVASASSAERRMSSGFRESLRASRSSVLASAGRGSLIEAGEGAAGSRLEEGVGGGEANSGCQFFASFLWAGSSGRGGG